MSALEGIELFPEIPVLDGLFLGKSLYFPFPGLLFPVFQPFGQPIFDVVRVCCDQDFARLFQGIEPRNDRL